MAPVNRTNIRRPRRTIARRRLAPLTRSIAALSLKQKPVLFRPRVNKVASRRNFVGLRNPRGSVNINSVSTLNGTERIATITIPTSSQPGDLLYTLENNPNSAPRARAVASQFDSWHSVTELEVETTGNAFAKNFIIIRHVPNGDPGRLPSDATSLLNFSEAYSRTGESFKLQLDSNGKGIVRAPWNGVSYNPRKPINDSDPSERNNGLFIIVSNGSPGAEPVDITIRYRYSFRFYGPIFVPLLPNVSSFLGNGSGFTPAAPFPLNMTSSGSAIVSRTTSSITLKPGQYYMTTSIGGTAITTGLTPSSPGVTFTPGPSTFISATFATQSWTFTLLSTATVTFAAGATTIVSAAFATAAYGYF